MLASMTSGLPFAIAAQFAYPGRQSVAVVGDGGFAMLMAEMTTAVKNNLPFKIILLKNDSLAEVQLEQEEIGNPRYGCDLGPIGFVAFAKACGADGFRCATPAEVRPAIAAALAFAAPGARRSHRGCGGKAGQARRAEGLTISEGWRSSRKTGIDRNASDIRP